ncbi:MAG: hypothetical protein EXS42_01740 [Lacunisphaera sp.]|nr:hypothetical protein [Lacunisphaera sp.]
MKIQFGKLFKLWAPIAALTLSGNLLLGQAKDDKDEVIVLDPFKITGESTKGWGATESLGGTRILTSILDTPMSIAVITKDLMDTVGAHSGFDSLRWVAGLGPAAQSDIGAYSLRGQLPRGTDTGVVDGLPAGDGQPAESEFIERWEVIKGAAGTLFGDHNLGGLVNRVYKRPLQTRQTVLGTSFSSIGNTIQGTIDTTGPIDRKGQLTYRAVGILRSGETSLGDKDDRKRGFYGTIEYAPQGSASKIWARYENYDYRIYEYTTSGIIDGGGKNFYDAGLGRRYTRPWSKHVPHYVNKYYEFGFSSKISGSLGEWNARFVARYIDALNLPTTPIMTTNGWQFLDKNGAVVGELLGPNVSPTEIRWSDKTWVDVRSSDTRASTLNGRSQRRLLFFDLVGAFNTGPLRHNMILYTQTADNQSISQQWFYTIKPEFGGSRFRNNLNIANAFSLINPVFVKDPFQQILPDSKVLVGNDRAEDTRYNAGIQDNIYFWDNRVLFVGGLRYDYVQDRGTRNLITKTESPNQQKSNVVNKLSVVVKPFANRGVAFFLNRSETFTPLFGELVVGSGIPFKNQVGISKEVGVKLEVFDQRLILTASYFEAEVQNLTIFLFNPATGFNEYQQRGVSPSKGWDLDATWTINDNWNVLVALSDVESKDFRGLFLRNVMNGFNYRTLVRWSAPSMGKLKGFSCGAGVVTLSDRVDATNRFTEPGYNQYEAFAAYARGKWVVQVNLKNLSDVIGTQSLTGRYTQWVNEPRSFELSTRYKF